jgi:hypothetical protein
MSEQSQSEPLSAVLLRQIDDVCLRFEVELQAGRRPDMHLLVSSFPEAGRSELLEELLLLEWDYRYRSGEPFSLEEYVQQLAPWRDAVERAWERWKGRAQLGETVLPATNVPSPSGTTDTPMALLPAGFEKSEPIGKGGMGEVCKAFDPRLRRWVALKQVRLDQADPNGLARFQFEAEALAKLAHPHIVKVHGFTDKGSEPVLEMEYVCGGTLEQRLKKGPPGADRRRPSGRHLGLGGPCSAREGDRASRLETGKCTDGRPRAGQSRQCPGRLSQNQRFRPGAYVICDTCWVVFRRGERVNVQRDAEY